MVETASLVSDDSTSSLTESGLVLLFLSASNKIVKEIMQTIRPTEHTTATIMVVSSTPASRD